MERTCSIPNKGLIIKEHWLQLILNGKKIWEIRGSSTTIRGKIALIQSGTSKIFGTVELIDSKVLSLEEYQSSEKYHCIPKEITKDAPYKKIHAWVFQNPKRLHEPIPYQHPQGAVIWVNLKEEELK